MSYASSRLAIGGAFGALVLATVVSGAAQPTSTTAASVPVVVELFTSEGCSSCPPADEVLSSLVARHQVAGADIIALGFHVDYWDELGWVDRFSSHAYTERQNMYAAAWRQDRIYTPQMVVDGATQFIGSDARAARQAIGAAAASAKVPVRVRISDAGAQDGSRVSLAIEVGAAPAASSKADVFLAVTEDGLVSEVRRGENANRRLAHAAVVRAFERVGSLALRDGQTLTRAVPVDRAWRRGALKLVVLVQEAQSRRVLGAAVQRLAS